MTKFKPEPRSDVAPSAHKSVEDFIATAAVKTVSRPLREWEKYEEGSEPSRTFQLRLNGHQYELLRAVAKHRGRSMHAEVIFNLMQHLREIEKELP